MSKHRLNGSERNPVPGAVATLPSHPDERIEVSVQLRPSRVRQCAIEQGQQQAVVTVGVGELWCVLQKSHRFNSGLIDGRSIGAATDAGFG